MSARKVRVLVWDHATPHLNARTLSVPYEGLFEGGEFIQDVTAAETDRIQRDIRKWQENLPAELSRIETAIQHAERDAPSKFTLGAIKRLQYLINQLRIVRGKQRQRDILAGYLLGRDVQLLGVLPSEPLVVKAKQQRARAQAAGKSRTPLRPEQKREAVAEVEALMATGDSLEAACKKLRRKYGVHFSTLKRYYSQR